MNPTSKLQQQYPLSPRKFWKKLIPKLLVFTFLVSVLVFIVPITVIIAGAGSTLNVSHILILVGISVGIFFITIFPYAWYVKVYIRRYYYDGEENFITIKKGVFAPGEIHVQWQKIQDVYVDQDILDRIMGLYDVHIASATASSGIEAHIDGVDQVAAEGLKQFLLNKVSGAGKNNVQSSVATQPLNQTPPSQPQVSTINLSEEISSNTYPLSGKWTAVTLFSRLIGSFVFPAFIILIFFGKSDDIIL